MAAFLKTLDRLLTGTVEMHFESIDQDAYLKPTDIYRYGDALGTEFWTDTVGMTHSEYYQLHHIGAVLTYVDLRSEDGRVLPQEKARVELQSRLGKYPADNGKPARYGGKDGLTLFNAAGEQIGSLEASWLWFHLGNEVRKPGTLTEAPPLYEAAQGMLAPPPPAFQMGEGRKVNEFRWTRRESDLNRHVNSIAYVQRIENGLADAGLDFRPRRVELWYLKPAFMGQPMVTVLEEQSVGVTLRMTQSDSGVTCIVGRVTR